jgi:hypothetical protein
LFFAGPVAKSFFDQMSAQKTEVEQEMGYALDWFSEDSHKQSRISFSKKDTSLTVPENWGDDYTWFRETLLKFDEVFRRRVAELK